MFEGVSDVFLPVSDLYRSIEWYEKVLGFRRLRVDERRGSAGLGMGDSVGLNLIECRPHRPLEFPPNKNEVEFAFNLRTKDIQAVHERLDAAGVDVDEITPSFDGSFTCFAFSDPDGNRMSVVCN
ncbi:MAG TPA: VOC family protein [Nocardioidaceae bacterium]|nr:VOC family protein [Nocardioidaceae bacterium]